EVLDHLLLAADHHAVTAFEAPHTAAGAHVHVVNLLRCELFGALDVVNVIRVSAIDENVACLQMGQQVSDSFVNDCGGNHQPQCPRFLELFQKIRKRSCSRCAILRQFVHCLRRQVENHTLMTSLDQSPHHVGAHSSQSYHSKLHKRSSSEDK